MLKALLTELYLQRKVLGRGRIHTLYFGGGTPSWLSISELSKILEALYQYYSLSELKEITIEANPEDISQKKLRGWLQLGINRLSIGVQSFHEPYLRLLGRVARRWAGLKACPAARSAGFQRVSMDLIYGVGTGEISTWEEDIRLALQSGSTHLSVYALSVAPGTPLSKALARGHYQVPSEDRVAAQLERLFEVMNEAGFVHYEASSFAEPGAEALHTCNYWRGAKYLGIGPSAESYNGYRRWQNMAHNVGYIAALKQGQLPPRQIECLSPTMRWQELWLTGLRSRVGIPLRRIQAMLGSTRYIHFKKEAQRLSRAGFLEITPKRIRPTSHGMCVADELAGHLSAYR